MIEKNKELKDLNSFGIAVKCHSFYSVNSMDDLSLLPSILLSFDRYLVLGGGSNILFTNDYDGLIIKNNLKGIQLKKEDENEVILTSAAGEVWNDLVEYTVERNLGGFENLSLIPGSVGAAPMQNIGAYGVEIKDTVLQVDAFGLKTGEMMRFSNDECEFGYRESIFKRKFKNELFITSVTFRLSKKPIFKTSYGALQKTLEEHGVKVPSVRAISEAICSIRRSKLPDPAKLGNAGSFFKNPEIPITQFMQLQLKFPNVVAFDASNGFKKVAAGWLIEQAGWKGKTFGSHGVHKDQALVLVNYGGASGEDLLNLSSKIKASVLEKFGIELQEEVNIV